MDADRWVFTNASGFMKYDDDDDDDEDDDVTSVNTVSLRLVLSLAFPLRCRAFFYTIAG